MIIAVLFPQAVYGFSGVEANHHDLIEFDEIVIDDEHSLRRVSRMVIGSKDPIIIPTQAVPAPDNHVRPSRDRVFFTDDDVVEL